MRQPPPTEGEDETTTRPIPIPGSAMWPPIGITMQYVPNNTHNMVRICALCHTTHVLYSYSTTCRLPQNYLFSEKPQLARWDEETKVWRTGGFQDVFFDLGRYPVHVHLHVHVHVHVTTHVHAPYN